MSLLSLKKLMTEITRLQLFVIQKEKRNEKPYESSSGDMQPPLIF
jgi:hypothetical protein